MAELQKSSSSSDAEKEENSIAGTVLSSSSPTTYDLSFQNYHVFINHRGPDVKMSLASVLYHYLHHLGLRVFMDMPELSFGHLFSVELERAVRSAAIHIAIFSPNYAYSPWCLAELTLMLKIKAKIVPVFYNVRQSDLRYFNNGIYADAFVKYQKEGRYLDKLQEWQESLLKVSFISGIESKTDDDLGSLCKYVVDTVLNELNIIKHTFKLEVAEYPVGLDEAIQQLEMMILQGSQNNKGNIIGIVGSAGVGKTTLIKEFYNRKHSSFCRSSVLLDISKAYANKTMANLQKKLLCDLSISLPPSASPVRSSGGNELGLGSEIIKSQLEGWYSRPFIILDGIDHVDQLEALAVNEFIQYGALVLVTCCEVGLLQSFGISNIHEIKQLGTNNARQLFCWHAFRQPYPLNGLDKMVDDFVKASAGLPLTLKVLGQHLYSMQNGIKSLQLLT